MDMIPVRQRRLDVRHQHFSVQQGAVGTADIHDEILPISASYLRMTAGYGIINLDLDVRVVLNDAVRSTDGGDVFGQRKGCREIS